MAEEGLVLSGLNLNASGLVVEEADFTPPKKRTEWAQGADADGSSLVRDPLFENRVITMKVRVTPKATMLLAAQAVAGISRKLEECELNPGGLPLVWTPADGTVPAITFYVLTGSITELPISQVGDSGYFVNAPLLTLELTCKPFGYGTEVVLSSVSGTAPILTTTVASVAGDVPAEGRLIVTDAASKNRRTVEWGLEQRRYNAATSLIIDSDDLLTSGFGGAQAAGPAGAYDPNGTGPSAIFATLFQTTTTVCGIAPQTHVGTFRVRARVRTLNAGLRVRLSWQDGDGAMNANPYRLVTVSSGYSDVDLGTITVTPAAIGTQQWSGQIEAVAPINGNQIFVDYLTLIPCGEGYGRARGPLMQLPGAVVAYDSFDAGTAGAALNGRTADGGGSWVTSGGTTDFVYDTGGFYKRSAINTGGPRYAVLGSNLSGVVTVKADLHVSTINDFATGETGVLCRFVDANNYLLARITTRYLLYGLVSNSVDVVKKVSGTTTTLSTTYGDTIPQGGMLALSVGLDGSYSVTVDGRMLGSGTDADLASGGALQSGKPGLYDYNASTSAPGLRTYDNFYVEAAPTPPPVLYAGRTIEFRSNGDAIRQNAAGTTYGMANTYRGGRFLVPAAGDQNRTSRIVVSAHRNDLDNAVFEPLGDNLTVQIRYTPRYLVVGA